MMKQPASPKKFIDEEITIGYHQEPLLQKVPLCPDFFEWQGKRHVITELISEWCDLARKGDSAKNMRPEHLTRAEKLGSWGTGRFFFQVKTREGRTFEIYYDRTPRKGDDRNGYWVLLYEIVG